MEAKTRKRWSWTAAYARFRGSPAFLIFLALYVVVWMSWNIAADRHLLPAKDEWDVPGDWGTLNVTLSIEASLSMALLLMDTALREAESARIDRRHEENLLYLKHLAEGIVELLESERDRNVRDHVASGGAPSQDAGDGLEERRSIQS